jgi:hypothetical protein
MLKSICKYSFPFAADLNLNQNRISSSSAFSCTPRVEKQIWSPVWNKSGQGCRVCCGLGTSSLVVAARGPAMAGRTCSRSCRGRSSESSFCGGWSPWLTSSAGRSSQSSSCGGKGRRRKTLARRGWGRPANEARWLSPHSQSQKAPPRVLSPERYFFAGFSYKRVHRICHLVGLMAYKPWKPQQKPNQIGSKWAQCAKVKFVHEGASHCKWKT